MTTGTNNNNENAKNEQGVIEYETIFRAYITKPDGTKIWAKNCGCKAFPIKVPVERAE